MAGMGKLHRSDGPRLERQVRAECDGVPGGTCMRSAAPPHVGFEPSLVAHLQTEAASSQQH